MYSIVVLCIVMVCIVMVCTLTDASARAGEAASYPSNSCRLVRMAAAVPWDSAADWTADKSSVSTLMTT